ncbi:MAG: DUF3562 domain-containing protein [Burkholderiales bacterium]
MTAHYATDAERNLYRARGMLLAKELGAPEHDVLMAYEAEVERLMAGARIKDFISILAEKQVKDSFRQRQSPSNRDIAS